MTRRRLYFEEPLVRAKISRIRFPKTCPVCGAPTSRTTRISTKPRQKVWLRPHWNPMFNSQGNNRLSNIETKSFLVNVCDDHSIEDNAEMRMRGLSTIVTSITVGISIFALIYAGADYWVGRPVSPWVYSYLLILIFSLLFVYMAFQPSALEAAIKIIGFDFDLQHVWLALRNPSYRDSFMKENPIGSELVTWIVKI